MNTMGLFDFLSRMKGGSKKEEKAGRQKGGPGDEILDGVERVMRLCVPDILRVSGYRRKLAPAVERTLSYADEVVGLIPGPIEIDDRSWAEDPLVNTIFAGVDQFRDFFSRNRELAEFFNESNAERCHALLTMNLLEKKILGVEKQGEIVKRDVPKISVNFDDCRIVAPMASERDAKREVSSRALSVLVDHVCEEIMFMKRWKSDMEEEKRILEAQIELNETMDRDIDSLFSGRPEDDARLAEAKDMVKQLERKIGQVRSRLSSPEDSLSKVLDVLIKPEKYLRAKTVRMRIGDMGIKIEEKDATGGREIRFCEFSLESSLKRSAVFTVCPRGLCKR